MKLKTVLIFVVALAIFGFTQHTIAKVVAEKPDLPQGYEAWPEVYRGICTDSKNKSLNIDIFARVLYAGSVELVVTLDFPSSSPVYLYNVFTKKNEEIFVVYRMDRGVWTKLDSAYPQDTHEIDGFLDMLNMALGVLCPSVDLETTNFFEKLQEQLVD